MNGRPTEPGQHRAGDAAYGSGPVDGHDERHEETRAQDVVAHEERAAYGVEEQESGRVRVRKSVRSYPVEHVVPREVEHVDDSERVPATEDDSGEIETLPDGSVSIPVFEEVLVVTKRLAVTERVIIRKSTVIDEYRLETELRREHVEVEGDDGVEVDDPGRDRT